MFKALAKTAVVGSMLAFVRRASGRETHYLASIGLVALGAVVGAGAALFLAPMSGRELREQTKNRARQLTAGAQQKIEQMKNGLAERAEDLSSEMGRG